MDKGVSYTYTVAAYPRVKYFQERLQKLIPRWQRILDAGMLPKCISQGEAKLTDILSLAHDIVDKVNINVFADHAYMKIDTLELHVQTNLCVIGDVDTCNVTWTSFAHEKGKKFVPTVTVIVLQSLDEKVMKSLQTKLSGISKAQLHHIIIYIDESKTNFTYTDLANANFQHEDVDLSDAEALDRSKCLNKQIQSVLEKRIITVLDRIADYNKTFIPKKQECVDESLQDAIHLKLLKSLRDPFVVKDLSPDNISGEAQRKPTDKELMKVAGAIGHNWELLGPSLGITEAKISEIKQSHQSVCSKIYHMLLLWQRNDRATLKYLLQLLENVSSVITVDMGVVKAMKEEFSAPGTDSRKDEVFHRKLLDFVAKKTKCVACDILSKKYGISTNLINEFLNEGFFSYEKKVAEMMDAMSLPSWPRDKKDDGVSTCRKFAHRCGLSMSKITLDTEEYIRTRRENLTSVKKLQFELFGLLQQTDVAIETKIPDIPKLPLDLQHALLGIEEVYGCGTMWGDLELHLTEDLSPASRDKVKELLLKYKYMYEYTTQLIKPPNLQVGHLIQQGSGIRATKIRPDSDGKYNYGSIGCFVKVKPNIVKVKPNIIYQRGAGNVLTDEGKLHCITCAHCVHNCNNLIEVYAENGLKSLGVKRFEEFNKQAIDVATIEINREQVTHCETTMQESTEDSLFRHRWSFSNETPLRRKVFKYGSATALTHGICMSDDYKTKEMMEDLNQHNNRNFDVNNTVLIGPEADQPPGTRVEGTEAGAENQQMQVDEVKVFSEKGDSGSVVCDDNKETGDVIVMALLCGDIRSPEGKYLYSYSTNIQKVIATLQEKYNCLIEPGVLCINSYMAIYGSNFWYDLLDEMDNSYLHYVIRNIYSL